MKRGLILLVAFSFGFLFCVKGQDDSQIRIGLIADLHDEVDRLQAFIDKVNEEKPDFIIQLGDFSNGKEAINRQLLNVWNTFPGKKYHVLGNHDLDHASKEEIIQRQEMPGKYYSFDCKGFHFIVLDCNYILKDGEYIDYAYANYYIPYPNRDLINPEQVEWLEDDIKNTDKPVIIFSHESLDDLEIRGTNPVPNREMVRQVIRDMNSQFPHKIIACFAGHDHVDHHNKIEGVHYFAVNSAYGFKKSLELKEGIYAFITLDADNRRITIDGTSTDFKKKPEKEDYDPYSPKDIIPCIKDREVLF